MKLIVGNMRVNSVLYSFSSFAYFKQACGEGEKPLIARYLGID